MYCVDRVKTEHGRYQVAIATKGLINWAGGCWTALRALKGAREQSRAGSKSVTETKPSLPGVEDVQSALLSVSVSLGKDLARLALSTLDKSVLADTVAASIKRRAIGTAIQVMIELLDAFDRESLGTCLKCRAREDNTPLRALVYDRFREMAKAHHVSGSSASADDLAPLREFMRNPMPHTHTH